MSNPAPNRKRTVLLSNVLFALVLIAAAVVAYLYFFDNRFFNEGPAEPACDTGRSELECVIIALRAQDFDRVEPGRYTARADQLSQPGQVIEINEQNAFLFIYPAATLEEGTALRESDSAKLDPNTVQITARTSERPLNEGEDIHIFEQGNVILIMVGGSETDVSQVQAAIDSLP